MLLAPNDKVHVYGILTWIFEYNADCFWVHYICEGIYEGLMRRVSLSPAEPSAAYQSCRSAACQSCSCAGYLRRTRFNRQSGGGLPSGIVGIVVRIWKEDQQFCLMLGFFCSSSSLLRSVIWENSHSHPFLYFTRWNKLFNSKLNHFTVW